MKPFETDNIVFDGDELKFVGVGFINASQENWRSDFYCKEYNTDNIQGLFNKK